jgi:TRAP-type C4-dicarboxylate transport system substrate-binding protein
MAQNSSSISDTFFSKLKEQSFTIILLVGILWYQNNTYKATLEDYKNQIKEKEATILKLTDDERQRLIERTQYLSEQRDKFVDELIEDKNNK